jgi:hypothetical protein
MASTAKEEDRIWREFERKTNPPPIFPETLYIYKSETIYVGKENFDTLDSGEIVAVYKLDSIKTVKSILV